MMELRLDGSKIREDVGVIELKVVQDGGAGAVVDELAALVEEGGVVFVRFDDEEVRWRQSRGDTEILRHAADQEARVVAGVLENPGQHRRGGRLAVRTGHGQHPLAIEHVLAQPLRAGDVRQVAVENGLHQRIAARDHVADHEQVRLQRELRRVEAFDQVDALGFQLGAHGRVDVGVAAGHAVTRLPGEDRKAAHESTADAEDVNMHGMRRGEMACARAPGGIAIDCTRALRPDCDTSPRHHDQASGVSSRHVQTQHPRPNPRTRGNRPGRGPHDRRGRCRLRHRQAQGRQAVARRYARCGRMAAR
ncbi:hypothetical protein D3C86_1374940 [compost metagenome]